MTDSSKMGTGTVWSADIAVPDHERELKFYAAVLGTGEVPLWRDDLLNSMGTPIIGLGERSRAYDSLPLQWMPHVQVEDVAASVDIAVALDGCELMHGKSEDGSSLWAVLQDPNGAAFGIIPAARLEDDPKASVAAVPGAGAATGCISLIELTALDATAVCRFYSAVVGWTAVQTETEASTQLQSSSGELVAKVYEGPNSNHGVPPVWVLRLPVGDLEDSLRLVREGGGEVIKLERGETGTLKSAVIRDPVGAVIGLVSS